MLLVIDDQLTVGEVEDRFTECFPYLQIRFYYNSRKRYAPEDHRFELPESMRLRDVRDKHTNQVMEIKSWYTIASVEKQMREKFGLNAQIFRVSKSGKTVPLILTENATLRQQMEFAFDPAAVLN